jgi:hypothetical protein
VIDQKILHFFVDANPHAFISVSWKIGIKKFNLFERIFTILTIGGRVSKVCYIA